MNLRLLGRTGLRVSEIGFGCGPTAALMITSSAVQRREAIACALDHGINYFDTAPGYGNALSEQNLGEALRTLRATPYVATKVALSFEQLDDLPAAINRSVDASLRRLEVAALSVIQLHNRMGVQRAPKAPFGTGAVLALEDVLGSGGVVEVFEALRARGLVRFFGCTAFGGDMGVVKQVIDSDAFDVITVHYSLLNETAWTTPQHGCDRDYACTGARASSRNMGTVALRVLEGGTLTPSGGDDATRVEASRIASGLSRWGLGLTEAGVRFALSNPQISTVLIGFSNVEQIEQALGYSNRGPLPLDVRAQIGSRH